MAKKNYYVYTGHSISEYEKKFANKGYAVVEKANTVQNPDLLKGKSWWYIGNKYYEVPTNKNAVGRWWKNMTTATRITFCVLTAVTVGCLVAIPIVATSPKASSLVEVTVTVDNVTATRKMDGDKLVITLSCSETGKKVKSIEKISAGNTNLNSNQYTFDASTQQITIKKEILDKNPGTITVTPVVGSKEKVYVTGMTCAKSVTIKVGETVSFDVLQVKMTPEDADDLSFTVNQGGQLNDDCIKIDNDKKTIEAVEAGEVSVEICANGVAPGSEKIRKMCPILIDDGTVKMTSIEVTTQPKKLVYTEGDTLDLEGIVVTGHYSDLSTKVLDDTEYYTNPYAGQTLTTQDTEVRVYSTSGSAFVGYGSFKITVNPKA